MRFLTTKHQIWESFFFGFLHRVNTDFQISFHVDSDLFSRVRMKDLYDAKPTARKCTIKKIMKTGLKRIKGFVKQIQDFNYLMSTNILPIWKIDAHGLQNNQNDHIDWHTPRSWKSMIILALFVVKKTLLGKLIGNYFKIS